MLNIGGKAPPITVLIGRQLHIDCLASYLPQNMPHKIKGICKCCGSLFVSPEGNPSAGVIRKIRFTSDLLGANMMQKSAN